MAAPSFVPSSPTDEPRAYRSPDVVPHGWKAARPAEVAGSQPRGGRLGSQGPDQGFAIKIAHTFRDRLCLAPGEHAADAIRGCVLVGLRRASLYGRAPVVHDLTIAFTIFGFLDAAAPAELVEYRRARFAGLAHGGHYTEARDLTDAVPEATLRMTPQQVAAAYPAGWRGLVGA